jgi:ubiquinone/menaquinone biosynthesis C-methylase UbiE
VASIGEEVLTYLREYELIPDTRILIAVGVALATVLLLLRIFSADFYDFVIVRMTAIWYAAVIDRLESGQRVFDVGIGTATALVRNKEKLLQKKASFVGIDYEAPYVRKAEQNLAAEGLLRKPDGGGGPVCVFEKSIYDEDLGAFCGKEAGGSTFDAAYFSGSLTVMPDPVGALRAVAPLLKPGGAVYITQTFQKRYVPLLATVKPVLYYVTTIDFGQLTYEEDIQAIVKAAEDLYEEVESKPIPGSVDTPLQTARLIVLKLKDKKKK